MRASFIIATIVATVASAFSLYPRQTSYPSCAFTCLGQSDLGGCSPTDNTCLCKNNAYIMATSDCINSSCTDPADIKSAADTSIALCKAAGVDITTLTASAAAATSPVASDAIQSAHSVPSTTAAAAAASQTPNADSTNSVSMGTMLSLVGVAAAALAL